MEEFKEWFAIYMMIVASGVGLFIIAIICGLWFPFHIYEYGVDDFFVRIGEVLGRMTGDLKCALVDLRKRLHSY